MALLLLTGQTIRGQALIKTFASRNEIPSGGMQYSGSKIYLGSYAGIVIYDTSSAQYQVIDGSNSPINGETQWLNFQVLNNDSLLIGTYFYTNNFYAYLSGWFSAITYDNRVFRSAFMHHGLDELINNQWYAVNDSALFLDSSYTFYYRNRDVYALSRNNLVHYEYGHWTGIPIIQDSIVGNGTPDKIWFDNKGHVYGQRHLTNYYPGVFELVNNNWIKLPQVINDEAAAFYRDSANNIYYVVDSSYNINGISYPNTFIRTQINGVNYNYPLSQLGVSSDFVVNGICGSSIDDLYLAGYFGFYHGSLRTGFAPINLGNICFNTHAVGTPIVHQKNGTLYIWDNQQDIVSIDTAFNYCAVVDTTVSSIDNVMTGYDSEYGVFFQQDHNKDVWITTQHGAFFKNISTGYAFQLPTVATAQVLAIRDSSFYWLEQYDNNYDSLFLINNGITTVALPSVNLPALSRGIDAWGNLWMDCADYTQKILFRLTPQGTIDTILGPSPEDQYFSFNRNLRIDNDGYAWGIIGDTLIRFGQNPATDTLLLSVPHSYMLIHSEWQVFDSSELIIGNSENLFYCRNGQWRTVAESGLGGGMNHFYTFGDGRVLQLTNYDGLNLYDFNAPSLPYANLLKGVVFEDDNADTIQQNNEQGFPYCTLYIDSNIYSTGGAGIYQAFVAGGNHVIKPNVSPYFIVYPDSFVVHTTAGGTNNIYDTLNFACRPGQVIRDLSVSITPTVFVNGFNGDLFVNVRNDGTTVTNASLTLDYDTSLTFLNSLLPPVSQTRGHMIIPLGIVYPLQQVYFYFSFYAYRDSLWSPHTDSLIHFVASVGPSNGDTTPANNIDSTSVPFHFAYDPNFKSVEPRGSGINNVVDTGVALTYTIMFQNAGNYAATIVKLVDTLSNLLDVSTFKFIASSHVQSFSLKGHILTVTYNNIQLPDSGSNEPLSHGYFKFSIKPVSAAGYGTQLNNRAYIYFDYNPAIVTNNTSITFGKPITGIQWLDDNLLNAINIYPNPGSALLHYKLDKQISLPAQLNIYNSIGELVIENSAVSLIGNLNVNSLPAGVYLVKLTDARGRTARSTWIKQGY